MEILNKLENRKAFKSNNVKIDRNNTLLMNEINKILSKYDVLKNEAKINNLVLLISSNVYENMFNRFEAILSLPSAPSKRRLELIYVDQKTVELKHKEKMKYKNKKRKYTLKQFFRKQNFKKNGLVEDSVSKIQKKELEKCFEFFYNEKEKYVSQSDLWHLLDFVLDPNKELDYINRIKKLRKMNGLHSTKEYKMIRYGKVTGAKLYDKFIENQRKINSLEFFIEKYGDEGEKKWKELNKRRGETTKFNWSEEGFKKRFGATWQTEYENWKELVTKNIENLPHMRLASKSSLAVFLPVLEKFKDIDLNYNIGFGDSKEFKIGRLSFDLTLHKINLIFEFQGKAFHPNPEWNKEYWENWKQAVTNKTADQVFAKDKFKKELAEKNGYEVIYIWEENNIVDNINLCISIINNRLKKQSK